MTENSENQTFRRTGSTGSATETSVGNAAAHDAASFAPREQLRQVLTQAVSGKPFSELYAVAFDHRTAATVGHVLLDALEEQGYGVDDFDAVGALTAAALYLRRREKELDEYERLLFSDDYDDFDDEDDTDATTYETIHDTAKTEE